MRKKYLFISVGFILVIFALGWEAARISNKHEGFNDIAHAIPVIRFERFDETRNALLIGLFNPGISPIEISRTALSYRESNKTSNAAFVIKEYDKKPLVLDPGDTILVPLTKSVSFKPNTADGNYWGELDFRIPGQADFYSLRHRIGASLIDDTHNSVRN